MSSQEIFLRIRSLDLVFIGYDGCMAVISALKTGMQPRDRNPSSETDQKISPTRLSRDECSPGGAQGSASLVQEQGQVRSTSIFYARLVSAASVCSAPPTRFSSRHSALAVRSAPCRSVSEVLPPTTPGCYWYRRVSGNTPPEESKGTSSSRN